MSSGSEFYQDIELKTMTMREDFLRDERKQSKDLTAPERLCFNTLALIETLAHELAKDLPRK